MATLKISDLSVGDWVRCRGRNGRIERLEVIRYDERIRVAVESDLGTMYQFVDIEDIDPIPITPEILEKNGLCVVEEDADFSEYELFGSENFSIFHIKGTFHYRFETPQASVVCWNVHQLQHALRLAGIDKEINL